MRQQGVIAGIVIAVVSLTALSLCAAVYAQLMQLDNDAYIQMAATGMGTLAGLLAKTKAEDIDK